MPLRALGILGLSLPLALVLLASAPPLDFPHGVAAGEATPGSVVLWVATDQATALEVEISDDGIFRACDDDGVIGDDDDDFIGDDDDDDDVRGDDDDDVRGDDDDDDDDGPAACRVRSETSDALTSKAVVTGLEPDTSYEYRWRSGDRTSDVGTFRTPPRPDAARSVRFAFSGDSDGTLLDGLPFFNEFEVLDAVRAEDPDFFVYLGDQIYSDSFVRGLAGMGPAVTLEEYRETWRVNRGYPALRNLLASTSILSIWDDHEVVNDYDGRTVDPLRYAAGRQAYFEYLPTVETGLPSDPSCAGDPLFKVFHWGSLVDVIVLDERSCRDADVEDFCGGDLAPTLAPEIRVQVGFPAEPLPGCLDALNDPSRTFLGPVQKQLFKEALLHSTAKFKFVVNELPIQQLYASPYDRWEGYAAERAEILNFIRDNEIDNVIFLATDIHANLVNDVFIDAETDNESIAQEFVTGPIARTSFGQNVINVAGQGALLLLYSVFDVVLETECQALFDLGYGLIEVDAVSETATITLKDETGATLDDDLDSTKDCSFTLGP